MTSVVHIENVPIPGDCVPSPFPLDPELAQKGGNLKQNGRLHLDCTLSAINSESEKTNFSVIPAEHTVSLVVRCIDTVSKSHLKAKGIQAFMIYHF